MELVQLSALWLPPLEVWELLFWPFAACLVLTGIHCYLGIHVVRRGVIFVDLAMAQIAFLGNAAAFFILHLVLGLHQPLPPHLPDKPSSLISSRTASTEGPATGEASVKELPVTEEMSIREEVEQMIPDDTGPQPDESAAVSSPTVRPGEESPRQLRSSLEHAAPYVGGLLFTLLGAALFSLGRLRHQHIPQEAIIGIVYAVSSALTLVLLYKAPHDIAEQTRSMLVGRLLFVDPVGVIETAALYFVIGVVHYLWRRPFLLISFRPADAEASGLRIRGWDFLFYATFGVIVTSSVQMAGVLLVFSYLIVPAVCAMLFFRGILPRLLFGWAIGFLGSVVGLGLAVVWDSPAGGSIVVAFGALLIVLLIVRALLGSASGHGTPS